jgi:rubrerythrin
VTDPGPVSGPLPAGPLGADEGGDPVCWLHRVCPACGRLADEDPPTRCPACGVLLEG